MNYEMYGPRGGRGAGHALLCLVFLLAVALHGACHAGKAAEHVDYGREENWAYFEQDASGKAVDVFFVCPTVFRGDEGHWNMELSDGETRRKFLGATNMEKGIYDRRARFFAPYYRMAGFASHGLSKEGRENCLKLAYRDVRDAFLFYLEHEGKGRPFLLAGFSQGSGHILRLLKEFGAREDVQRFLVAAYCPGWILTPEDISAYPHLVPAKGEDDTGVIISFNTEAVEVEASPIVPAKATSISINPLSWRTDNEAADKAWNLGACFTGYDGEIKREIPALTGAYIAPGRGTLKATDINPEDYPPRLSDYPQGVYHIYDYQFFYRNLQENVALRVAAWQKSHAGESSGEAFSDRLEMREGPQSTEITDLRKCRVATRHVLTGLAQRVYALCRAPLGLSRLLETLQEPKADVIACLADLEAKRLLVGIGGEYLALAVDCEQE